ncbi:hypothetical protein [Pantoea sp. B65]|uniref:hypothetical protein n=1 Tax=Pantoea sp. B65 TaxID=2813359 RepID=UPI0039B58873
MTESGNITQFLQSINRLGVGAPPAAQPMFPCIAIGNSEKSIAQGDFRYRKLTRRQRVELREQARAEQRHESAALWQTLLTGVRLLPAQGGLPAEPLFPPISTPGAAAIKAAAELVTRSGWRVCAGSAPPQAATERSPDALMPLNSALTAASHYGMQALQAVDRALGGLFTQLLPWRGVGGQSTTAPTAVAEAGGLRPKHSCYRIHKQGDNHTLFRQQIDEFIDQMGWTLDGNQQQQLINHLSATDIIFIYPSSPDGNRPPRVHEEHMRMRSIQYEMALKDKTVAADSLGARIIAWGDKQNENSVMLFIEGTRNYNPFYFLASGGEAVLGYFARITGELFSGTLLDREPGEREVDRLLRLSMNIVIPEQLGSKAFNFRPLRPGSGKPLAQLPGTLISHPPTGITVHSLLQKEINGQRWLLIPQGENQGMAIPAGSEPAASVPATRNPQSRLWRINRVEGEHRFSHSQQPELLIKFGDRYQPVKFSPEDGCCILPDGEKIYFHSISQQWTLFYPGNSHLHARALSVIGENLIQPGPGQQGVLAGIGPQEGRVWSVASSGKQYLEVRAQGAVASNVDIGYVEGRLEGEFFTISASESQPVYRQTVLKWQPTSQKWDSTATSPFHLLKNADGHIDLTWLQRILNPARDLIAVHQRPGLYRVGRDYFLRWENSADGVARYLEVLPGEKNNEYRTPQPAAEGEVYFRYDEHHAQWQFLSFTHDAFAALPPRVKVQPTFPFSADYALPEYRNTYLSGSDIWIHTGADRHGVAEYIHVQQDAVDGDLFSLRVPNERGPDSLWVFRYDEDDEFVLEEQRLCQPRGRRGNDDECVAGPSGIQPPVKKVRTEPPGEAYELTWLEQHPRLLQETLVAEDDASVRGKKNLAYALRLSLASPLDISVNAIAAHSGVEVRRLRAWLSRTTPEIHRWFVSYPQQAAESDINYALRLCRLSAQGITLTAIARHTGVKENVIRMWLKRFPSDEIQWFILNPRREQESSMEYALRLSQLPESGASLAAIAEHAGVYEKNLRTSLKTLSSQGQQWLDSHPQRQTETDMDYALRLSWLPHEGVPYSAIAMHARVNEKSLRSRLHRLPAEVHQWLNSYPRAEKEEDMAYAIRLYQTPHDKVTTTMIATRAGVDESLLLERLGQSRVDKLASQREKQWLNSHPRNLRESNIDYALRLTRLRDGQVMAGTLTKKLIKNNTIALHARITPQFLSMNIVRMRNAQQWLNNHPRLLSELLTDGDSFLTVADKNRQYALRLVKLRNQQQKTLMIRNSDIAGHSWVPERKLKEWLQGEKTDWFSSVPRESAELVTEDESEFTILHKNQLYARRLDFRRAEQHMGWLITDKNIATQAGVTMSSFRLALKPEFDHPRPQPVRSYDAEMLEPTHGLLHLQLKQNPPLLADPRQPARSITSEVISGPVFISDIQNIVKGLPKEQREEVAHRFASEAQLLVESDGGRQDFFIDEKDERQPGLLSQKLEIHYNEQTPDLGWQIIAREAFKAYEFVGAYSGIFHRDAVSLREEYKKMGSQSVLTYLWGVYKGEGAVSGYQNANKLALINTAALAGHASQGENNLAVGYINDKIPFYYTTRNIEKGDKLLISYGNYYQPDYLIQTAINNDVIRIIAGEEKRYFIIKDMAGKTAHIYGPAGEVDVLPAGVDKSMLKERLDNRGIVRYDAISKKTAKRIAISKDDENNLYHALAKAINPLAGRDIIEEKIKAMKEAVAAHYAAEEGVVKLEPLNM